MDAVETTSTQSEEIQARSAERTSLSKNPFRDYLDAVKTVVEDSVVSVEEFLYIDGLRQSLGLTQEQIKAVHARVYAAVLDESLDDQLIDAFEEERLVRLSACLRRLGWAPGFSASHEAQSEEEGWRDTGGPGNLGFWSRLF